MPQFTNLDDLSKWLNTQAGQQTMTTSGKSIEEIMITEANRLKDCIQKRLDEYYNFYSPRFYERTYGLQNSMSVDDFVNINISNGTATIKIDFDQVAIQAHSVIGEEWNGYNKVELINNGWKVRDDVWFADVEHFGKFSGSHFIENGIADYSADNPYNLKIELQGFHS